MKKQIKDRIEQAIDHKVFPGCVVGVITPDSQQVLPFGSYTYEGKISTKEDTVYDIASVTKAVAAHCTLLRLVDEGHANLSDSVGKYLSEFNTSEKKESVTLEHLLTYTVNLKVPKTSEIFDISMSKGLHKLLTAPLRVPSGKEFLYSNTTAILISLATKQITGKRLDETSKNLFFKPLKMGKTTFHPDQLPLEDIAPTEMEDRLGRTVRGEVHDESTYLLQQDGRYLGAAGLFSTAPDLLRFLRMLLQKGTVNDQRCFSTRMIHDMFSVHFPGPEHTMGLGWELDATRFMGSLATENTFGSPGFTGCSLVGDCEREAGVVLLSNRIYPQRPESSETINSVRSDLADIVWQHVDRN